MLPTNQIFLTQARQRSLDFNEGEILKIIRNLNINKAHGHDEVSIRMIKICDKSLLKPLIILFENSIKHLVTQIFGKNLMSFLHIKKMTND